MSTAYFDTLFSLWGVPPLVDFFGDTNQQVHYEDGRVEADFTAIIQDKQILERQLIDGIRVRLELCTLIVSTDRASGWGFLASPQLNGIFEFDGAKWIVDLDAEVQGIEAISGNFSRIKVRKMSAIAQGYPEIYKRS